MSTSVTCIFITSIFGLGRDAAEQRDEAGQIARGLGRGFLGQTVPAHKVCAGWSLPVHAPVVPARRIACRDDGRIRV
jgi:hypothetical protein